MGNLICGTSKQVTIFTTPSICSAALVSMDLTTPFAMVECSYARDERTAVTEVIAVLARPVALSNASTRRTLLPPHGGPLWIAAEFRQCAQILREISFVTLKYSINSAAWKAKTLFYVIDNG